MSDEKCENGNDDEKLVTLTKEGRKEGSEFLWIWSWSSIIYPFIYVWEWEITLLTVNHETINWRSG